MDKSISLPKRECHVEKGENERQTIVENVELSSVEYEMTARKLSHFCRLLNLFMAFLILVWLLFLSFELVINFQLLFSPKHSAL
jgi:hypothetical protein